MGPFTGAAVAHHAHGRGHPTVVLFASDAGSYYVGATMNMNGGDDMI